MARRDAALPSFASPSSAYEIGISALMRELHGASTARASLRAAWKADPVSWIRDRLGEHIWSKQRAIIESVRDHRRTAVQSCHSSGKSWTAARIVAWWLASHEPGEAFVVTSAPTGRQVRAILWREIGRAHAAGRLDGRLNLTEWWLKASAGNEELVAFGQKPADMDPSAFQGIHARAVLVIFDEACGIPEPLWIAADTLIANEESRFLAIGNPDDPTAEFAAVCAPGSGWNVITVSAFDTPNMTGEAVPDRLRHVLISPMWVEEKRAKWGETNPLYISKVLGQFPESAQDGLIPLSWIRAAQERELPPSDPVELGVDVGGGGDRSVIAVRRGPVVRVIRRDQTPNTMHTYGNVLGTLRDERAHRAKVDEVGIGRGMVDLARDQGRTDVVGVNVGQSAKESEAFQNLRAEGYWALRERFQQGEIDIDPADDDLAAQLASLRFKRSTNGGRIQIESKDEMKRRGLSSPDDADAVMLAFIDPPEPEKRPARATWGTPGRLAGRGAGRAR